MRALRKNQQKLQYSLQIVEIPEFENIYYKDNEGNEYLIDTVVSQTGKTEVVYSPPTDFLASISMSGGEAEAVEYGLSQQDFSAVIILPLNTIPLKEGALIWHTSEPKLKHIEMQVNDTVLNGDYAVRESADFYIVSVRNSLNVSKIILQAINK